LSRRQLSVDSPPPPSPARTATVTVTAATTPQFTAAAADASATPRPPSTPPVVVLFHGLGDHAGSYDDFAGLLLARLPPGALIRCFDQPGHGRLSSEPGTDPATSERKDDPRRILLTDWDDRVSLCLDYVAHCRELAGPDAPLVLAGCSMGGLLAACVGVRVDASLHGVRGALLLCPALDVRLTAIMRLQSLLKPLLLAIAPRARLVDAVRRADLTDEADVLDRWTADPLIYMGKTPVITAAQIQRGFGWIQRRAADFTLPVRVVHGTADRCTDPTLSRAWLERTGCTTENRDYVPLQGALHLIHVGRFAPATADHAAEFIRRVAR